MEFRGKLNELGFDREGNNKITLTAFSDCRNEFDELADKEVSVIIKPYRKKRSLSVNAYAWVLLDKLSACLGKSKEEIYKEEIRDIGGVSETVCIQIEKAERLKEWWKKRGLGWQVEEVDSKIKGCVCLTLYAGSSEYDTKQMSILVDRIVQDCKQQGIETLPPAELEHMLGKWDEAWRRDNGEEHNAG